MNEPTNNPLDTIAKALAELSEHRTSIDAVYSDLRFLQFKGKTAEENYGKGLLFIGGSYNKQFTLGASPDRFFSTENVDLAKDRHFSINGSVVVSERELGPSVTKSSLKQVGRLNGLIVDGSLNINQYLFYNGSMDRLGLGTDAPNAALSVAENAIEVMIGTSDNMHGMIGTYASTDLDIVTDNTARIIIKGNGNIDLGNPNRNPVQVTINGKLSVGVAVPDPAVDLHVAGPARINNKLQISAKEPPKTGTYGVGDIVWNSGPRVNQYVGWVCLRAGSPGSWFPFGEIKERG
jgi:hypothetical protein